MSEDYETFREAPSRLGRAQSGALVFGLTDGVALVLGLLLGMVLSGQSGLALWHAALGGGLAELGGMSLGQYWSDPDRNKGAALANGLAACLAPVLAALPFLLLPRYAAVPVSVAVVALESLVICILREEQGWRALARTFGLLAVVGVLAGVSGLA